MANRQIWTQSPLSEADTRKSFRAFACRALVRQTLLGLPLIITNVLAQLVAPLIMLQVINLAARGGPAAELGWWIGLILFGSLGKSTAVWLGQLWLGRRALRLAHQLRLRVTASLWNSEPERIAACPTGDLLARLDSDVTVLFQTLAGGLGEALRAALTLAGSLVCMGCLDLRLTLGALLLCLPALAISYVFTRRLGHLYELSRQSYSGLLALAHRNLLAVRSIRALAREREQSEEFLSRSQAYSAAIRSENLTAQRSDLCLQLLFGINGLVVMWLGSLDVAAGRLSVGGYLAFSSYALLMVWPVTTWAWMAAALRRGAISLERLCELFPEQPCESEPVAESGQGSPLLEVRGLTFAGLRDLNFCIQPGQKLALTGPSGSGKSLLTRLISGLERAPRDSIRRGGLVGLVAQNGFIFSASIRENVAWGRPEASDSEVQAALRVAGLDQEVAASSQGLQTLVGERGIRLSAGQRQRLCLARALLWGPPLLILDDCLSNLDRATENAILARLWRDFPQQAVLLVSHRLASLRRAESVLILEDGRVTARGSHQQLMAENAFYQSLERRL